MTAELTRSQLLRGGVRGGATLLVAGSALGAYAVSAQAAPPSGAVGPLAAADLANTRLLIGVELLLIDFYTNAIASRHLRADAEADARLALINEAEHYDYLSFVLTSAGLVALTSADVDFTYPAGAYYTADSVTALAVTLETLALGAYLGAAGNLTNPVLAGAVAQIGANEAQHVSVFSQHAKQPAFHDAFPAPLTTAEASDALDGYTS
jgi:hypothetical protein